MQKKSANGSQSHLKSLGTMGKEKLFSSNAHNFQSIQSNITKFSALLLLQVHYKILWLDFQEQHFVEIFDECSNRDSFGWFLAENGLGIIRG